MENELLLALTETAMTRTLPQDVILEALQAALVSAYRREKNASASQAVEARIDTKTGRARLFVEKEVVEAVEYPDTEVSLEKARFYNPEADLGETVNRSRDHAIWRFVIDPVPGLSRSALC